MNSVPLILAVGSAHDHVWPIMCIRYVDGPEWEMLDIELNRCVDISAIQYVGLHALHISHLSVFLWQIVGGYEKPHHGLRFLTCCVKIS
jgi:hypothetical protein